MTKTTKHCHCPANQKQCQRPVIPRLPSTQPLLLTVSWRQKTVEQRSAQRRHEQRILRKPKLSPPPVQGKKSNAIICFNELVYFYSIELKTIIGLKVWLDDKAPLKLCVWLSNDLLWFLVMFLTRFFLAAVTWVTNLTRISTMTNRVTMIPQRKRKSEKRQMNFSWRWSDTIN